jgi:hypothetical protein
MKRLVVSTLAALAAYKILKPTDIDAGTGRTHHKTNR